MGPSLLLVFSFHLGAASPASDRWFAADKVKHFASGVFAQSLGYGTIRLAGGSNGVALAGASLGTVSVAAWKERRDRNGRGTVSMRDFTWTVAGGGAASVLLAQTRR